MEEHRWQEVADLCRPRAALAAAACQGRLYALGGADPTRYAFEGLAAPGKAPPCAPGEGGGSCEWVGGGGGIIKPFMTGQTLLMTRLSPSTLSHITLLSACIKCIGQGQGRRTMFLLLLLFGKAFLEELCALPCSPLGLQKTVTGGQGCFKWTWVCELSSKHLQLARGHWQHLRLILADEVRGASGGFCR